jgi:hypothetical protein
MEEAARSPVGSASSISKDGTGGCEPFDVGLRKGGSEESDDVWESGLCDAHDGPWTLDQRLGTVGIVEDLGLGEVSGETPFAKASHLAGSILRPR